MTGLYESYISTAEELAKRISVLSEQIACEKDLKKADGLRARLRLLMQERYDLLDIARSLRTGSVWGEFY